MAAFSCPLCGSAASAVRYAEDWITIRRCGACGFLYTEDRTGDFRKDSGGDDISAFYAWLEQCQEARVPLLAKRLRDLLQRAGVAPGAPFAAFEIGYGGGTFARAVSDAGGRYVGLEPLMGEAFHREADIPEGATVLPLRFEDFATDERFDLIAMDNVLEHIADPMGTLQRTLTLLKPGGVCWVQVPNEAGLVVKHRLLSLLKNRYVTFPGHVNLFTAKTLRRAFAEAGYRETSIGFTSASDPVLTRLLMMRDPGLFLKTAMAVIRTTKVDVLGRWAYWLDAYGTAPARP
jgi:SAM-dependent methyltransferase